MFVLSLVLMPLWHMKQLGDLLFQLWSQLDNNIILKLGTLHTWNNSLNMNMRPEYQGNGGLAGALTLKWLNLLLSTFDPGFDKVGPPFPTDSSHFVEILIWGIGYSRVQVEFHGTNHISHMLVDVEMAKTFQQFLHWNPEICCRGIISASSQKVV